MYVTEPYAQKTHTHPLMYNFYWILFPKCWQFISNTKCYFKMYIFEQKPSNWHIYFPNCWQNISNTNIYFVIFIFVFRFEEYMSVVFIYIGIVYIIPTIEGNVSIRGFLCAQECTFGNIYICIGYMLLTFGEYTSVGGFLCALRAQS